MVQIERPAAPVEMEAPPIKSVTQTVVITKSAIPEQPATEPPVAEAAPVPPELPIASSSAANFKLLLWSLGAFATGVAVTGAVLMFRSDPKPEATSVAIQQQHPAPVVDASANEESTTSVEVAEEVEETNTPTEEVEESITREENNPAVEEPPVATEEVAIEPQPEPPVAAKEPRIARRFDPLDFDPENLDLSSLTPTDEVSVTESVEEELIEEGTDLGEPMPSTMPSVRRDLDQTIEPAVAEERLKQRIPALEVNKMPLGDYFALISRLSGLPISVAPEELQMAGITARKSVSLEASDLDLAEALKSVLNPLHLEYKAEGPFVKVVRKGGDNLRKVTYPLDDLDQVSSVDEIATWVEQLVAPAEWQAVGGAGTIQQDGNSIQVKQSQRVQYQVLIFLERLRLANKLPARSRFPIKRFGAAPADVVLASRLKAPTVFTFSHYTELQEIVQHWQAELGVPILVDWPALLEFDLWPQTRLACAIDDKPWHGALSEILEPLGLGWRAVAGGMIEITSAEKVLTEPRLEVYTLNQAPADGVDRLLADLDALAVVKSPDLTPTQPVMFDSDASAKVIFVLQSADVQRKVHQWLVKQQLLESNK